MFTIIMLLLCFSIQLFILLSTSRALMHDRFEKIGKHLDFL